MIAGHQRFSEGIGDRRDTDLAATTDPDYQAINAPPSPQRNKNELSGRRTFGASACARCRPAPFLEATNHRRAPRMRRAQASAASAGSPACLCLLNCTTPGTAPPSRATPSGARCRGGHRRFSKYVSILPLSTFERSLGLLRQPLGERALDRQSGSVRRSNLWARETDNLKAKRVLPQIAGARRQHSSGTLWQRDLRQGKRLRVWGSPLDAGSHRL